MLPIVGGRGRVTPAGGLGTMNVPAPIRAAVSPVVQYGDAPPKTLRR
jgi:hypothetical protein